MTSLLDSTKAIQTTITPSASTANLNLEQQKRIDFTRNCHYTLDVFICTHKHFRKPRVTHRSNCPSTSTTTTKRCPNIAKVPRIVEMSVLCKKCDPGSKVNGIDISDAGGEVALKGGMAVRPRETYEGRRCLLENKISKKGEGSTESDEWSEKGKTWMHFQKSGSIHSFKNGEPEVKTSVLQRIYRAFVPAAKAVAEEESKGTADVDKVWTELEREMNWMANEETGEILHTKSVEE